MCDWNWVWSIGRNFLPNFSQQMLLSLTGQTARTGNHCFGTRMSITLTQHNDSDGDGGERSGTPVTLPSNCCQCPAWRQPGSSKKHPRLAAQGASTTPFSPTSTNMDWQQQGVRPVGSPHFQKLLLGSTLQRDLLVGVHPFSSFSGAMTSVSDGLGFSPHSCMILPHLMPQPLISLWRCLISYICIPFCQMDLILIFLFKFWSINTQCFHLHHCYIFLITFFIMYHKFV